jgi:hypothetical protein
MTYLAAVAPPVPVPSRDPAPATLAVAEALQPDLAQGFQIDAPRLRIEMERAFGGSDADGAWNWKLAYEAGEVALVLFLRKFGRALLTRAGSPAALLPIVAKVACLLPTHTRRSEEMERFQQFSTPLPMGLAAMAAAQITPRDLVLEPSAGTGLLAILAEIAGGSLALNELAETRADLLRHLFPGRPVTTFDAAQIDDHLDAGFRPSVILMNPPFSAVANVDGRSTEATARHLRSALARLVPGGRLVAITGAGFAPDAPAWAETFARLPDGQRLAVAVADIFDALVATLEDTRMEPDLEEVLWGQVNLFHRATARIERSLDENEQAQRRLHREQDGSEVKSTELERLTAEGLTLIERRNCMDMMRDHAAIEFVHHTGSTWRPRTGSMVNRQHMTAALIDSRDFLAAKRRAETEVMFPAGPKVALTGGTDFNDHRLIWGKLDQVQTKYPDMVLLHGGSPKGAELIAAKWAEARGVTQVAFKPDWTKHAKAAPFKRNDAMLDVLPVGVLVFQGNGIQENLADKARKLGIPVVKFERGA